MARIRTIKPEFWSDEEIGELSSNARLLFIASWNIADDEGLLKWTPQFIKAQVFAYDDLTAADVAGFMQELTDRGLIHPYKGGANKPFGWIVNFRKHQKIDRPQPAKHPLPSLQNRDVRERYAIRDNWTCHICNGEIPRVTNDRSSQFSLDHLSPRAKGGVDCPSNIRAAHFGCNASKKDRAWQDDGDEPISSNDRRMIDAGRERKGREGNREGNNPSHDRGTYEVGDTRETPFDDGWCPPGS